MCEDYYFGFLDYPKSISFDGGTICSVDEGTYAKGREWIEEHRNSDGFVYPPPIREIASDPDTLEKIREIPNTERPALLYRLPKSHKICLSHPTDRDIRKADGAFLVHLLAYLFETRLQFHDWWFDNRVPLGPTKKIFTHQVLEDFLDHSYCKWKKWKPEERNLMTNLLFMFSRAPSYEWDWEHFIIEYMVFDGLYKLVCSLHGPGAKTHKERFKFVCDKFGIKHDEPGIDRIYKLRNDLFHEALWDKSSPGMTDPNSNALYQADNLRRFNSRLIPTVLGYTNKYVSTAWWSMSSFPFGKRV